jgi:hypothetical protein
MGGGEDRSRTVSACLMVGTAVLLGLIAFIPSCKDDNQKAVENWPPIEPEWLDTGRIDSTKKGLLPGDTASGNTIIVVPPIIGNKKPAGRIKTLSMGSTEKKTCRRQARTTRTTNEETANPERPTTDTLHQKVGTYTLSITTGNSRLELSQNNDHQAKSQP